MSLWSLSTISSQMSEHNNPQRPSTKHISCKKKNQDQNDGEEGNVEQTHSRTQFQNCFPAKQVFLADDKKTHHPGSLPENLSSQIKIRCGREKREEKKIFTSVKRRLTRIAHWKRPTKVSHSMNKNRIENSFQSVPKKKKKKGTKAKHRL
jgi:hypothetical protein